MRGGGRRNPSCCASHSGYRLDHSSSGLWLLRQWCQRRRASGIFPEHIYRHDRRKSVYCNSDRPLRPSRWRSTFNHCHKHKRARRHQPGPGAGEPDRQFHGPRCGTKLDLTANGEHQSQQHSTRNDPNSLLLDREFPGPADRGVGWARRNSGIIHHHRNRHTEPRLFDWLRSRHLEAMSKGVGNPVV